MKYTLKAYRDALALLSIFTLVLVALAPITASAAQITNRKLTLGSSAPLASTTYTFNFTLPSSTAVQSFEAQICTTPSGACSAPGGFVNSASVSVANLPGTWTGNTATAGSLRASTTTVTSPTNPVTVTFSGVTNPSAASATFYARLTTYSDTGWATPIDQGTVAAATNNQISFTGSIDETLTFCVGITVTGNCASTTGTAVTFSPNSLFSSTATRTATSQFAAATNAASGYVVTVNGATLTSGSNTIAAAGTQSANGSPAASSTGTSQFGMNVVANTSPTTFGANVSHASGNSVGTFGTNYGTANNYRFFTGDTVATTGSQPSDFDTYTASYIVNISGFQQPGIYATTFTYICTATF